MAIRFEFYQSPNTIGTNRKRYHARVVNLQHVDTDYLAEEIHSGSTLTVGDIKATLISLSQKLAKHLREGERVYLEGIGYFQVTLKCPETRTPKSTRANQVKFKSVAFRADKYLKGELQTVHTERSPLKIHSSVLSDKEMDEKLTAFFAENHVMTRRDFQYLCHLTTATACRSIKKLVEEKKLRNISIPRNPIYEPIPGYYGIPLPEDK